jgi:hypothetical protein
VALQCVQAIFILWHAIVIGEGSSKLGILPGGPSPFIIWYASRKFMNLMFPLWFDLLGGSFCLLGCGSFHFVPCIPPYLGALVFILLAGFHHFEIAEFNLSLSLSLSFVFWGAFNLSLLNATIIIHELCIAVVPVRLVGGQYQILPLFFTYWKRAQ